MRLRMPVSYIMEHGLKSWGKARDLPKLAGELLDDHLVKRL